MKDLDLVNEKEKIFFENVITLINTLEEKELNFINVDYLQNKISFIDKDLHKDLYEEVEVLIDKIKEIQNER